MKLLAGFALTCLGLDQRLGFLFNLLLVQESLVPVHSPALNIAFIFSFAFLYLLPLKIPFWFHQSLRGSGSATAVYRTREIWVQVLVAFEGSYVLLTQSKPSPPTRLHTPWGCRD